MSTRIFLFIFGLLNFSAAEAAELPVRARVYLGVFSPALSEVNSELKTNSLEEIKSLPAFGAEVTYSILPALDLGINYTKKQNVKKSTSAAAAPYQAELEQDVFLAIVRFSFIKAQFFRMDVFGAAGGANTSLSIYSSSQNGAYLKTDSREFLASFATRYGLSIGAGFRGVYLFIEGGFEANKPGSLTTTGNVNGNIKSIDMSGSYGAVGLTFDTPEITKR